MLGPSQNPPGIRWKKIDTPHYEIVFPSELIQEGLRVADTMERLDAPLSKSLHAYRKRFSIFLTNRGVEANGSVGLAPRMSAWFHQPPQGTFLGSGAWIDLLAVHEGRHMVQFDRVNTGFTRIAGALAGEYGVLALSAFALPGWWWEGDAVAMETALTRSGRGRIPEFGMGIRTLLASGARISYSKAYLGSYRDWTPDIYRLGYPIVAHGRLKYGEEIWDRVIGNASRWSFLPFSFDLAMKKATGKWTAAIVRETMDDLANAWSRRTDGMHFPKPSVLSPPPRVYTEYLFPRYLNDSIVVAQKTGFDTPLTVVLLNRGGREKPLSQISPLEPGGSGTSTASGKIAWDEAVPDIRWGARSFSSIVIMDAGTGRTRRIVDKCRWFNPALSPDGRRIAAVEFTEDCRCAIVILDAETGLLFKRIPAEDGAFLQSPSWAPDGRRIVMTFQKYIGKGLSMLDIDSGEFHGILTPRWDAVSNPVLWDRYAIFSSPKSGIDNIHAVDLETGAEYRLTSVPFGAFSPQVSPDGTRLLFANHSPGGRTVCETDLNPSGWLPADSSALDATGYADALAAREGGPVFTGDSIPRKPHRILDYNPLAHGLNVHSWLPVPNPPEFSLFFYSTDKLNTTAIAFGPVLNTNENAVRMDLTGTYAGLFPVFDFGFSRGGRTATVEDADGEKWTDRWTETSAEFGIRVPLNLSRGVHSAFLELAAGASIARVSDKRLRVRYDNFNGDLVPFRYAVEFSRARQGSRRDLAPPWGQRMTLEYRHTPWASDYRGSRLSVQSACTFPGLMRHHAFLVHAAWERQEPDNYLFSSSFPFSRGYDAIFHRRLAFASAGYAFPIFYPDWTLGPLLYLKRVKGKCFYDLTLGIEDRGRISYRSFGFELGFDLHLLNLPLPLDLGVRFVRRIEDCGNRIEPVLTVNMN